MPEANATLIDAFKAHAIGERRKHEATLDILLSSPVIIPSHTDIFAAIDVRLIDFKLEFGRPADGGGGIMLADEISPDNCRLWQVGTDEKMDKDRFRRDLGGLTEAYAEIAQRLGIDLPEDVSSGRAEHTT